MLTQDAAFALWFGSSSILVSRVRRTMDERTVRLDVRNVSAKLNFAFFLLYFCQFRSTLSLFFLFLILKRWKFKKRRNLAKKGSGIVVSMILC